VRSLTWVWVCLLLAMPASSEEVLELDELRDAILESRERVGRHERQERALLEQLDESARLLAALGREVRSAQGEAAEAREQAAHFERQSGLARRRLEATREAMSRRVVALYKAGEVGSVRFLFASQTLPELLMRASALETFVEYDAALLLHYREYLAAYDDLEQQAKAAMSLRDVAASRLTKRSAQLSQERAERRRILSRVRWDRTSERSLLVELEKAARALEDTLRALGDTGAGGPVVVGQSFVKRKGRLAPPLDSAIELDFGKVVDQVFRTETFRKGVAFTASGGESVRAVGPGAVRFAGWFRGYGELVIVDHGDEYFSVSGHLDEVFVQVGDVVSEGDTLGSVGETGSLSGPSLYFEIRHGSQPEDPAGWFAPQSVLASPQ
jgi:septal ring factor EnvC (AmiA/AmiB activator)